MITQQRVRISATTIAATLAVGAALAIGGATGYTVRGLAHSPSATTAESAPAPIVNPGIGLHRADTDDGQPASADDQTAAGTGSSSAAGPVSGRNPGIGLGRDAEATGTGSIDTTQ